jgi:ABC-type molybdenum transport system ATPase subunit/photorepair protein PhrA
MRLVAIYISEHFLFDGPQTINLGGEWIYDFSNLQNIARTRNKKYIDDFWGKDIELISAIVGSNGTGKTSILRQLCLDHNDKITVKIFEVCQEYSGAKTIHNHLKKRYPSLCERLGFEMYY